MIFLKKCLKITEKVSFNILSGQKLIKNAEMVHFGELLKTWSLRSNSVTRQVSFLIGQKLVENAKIRKIQMQHFEQFSNNVNLLTHPVWYFLVDFHTLSSIIFNLMELKGVSLNA